MTRYIYVMLLIVIGAPQHVFSQHTYRTISGLVTSGEDGNPLEGVLVSARGSRSTSGSQQDGMYYIQVTEKDSVLVFSLNDFEPLEVRLSTSTDYNIQLHKGQPGQEKSQPGQGKTIAFNPTGPWRAIFQLRPDLEVPVIFDIHTDPDGVRKAFFHNAEELFEGGRVEQTPDSLFIYLDAFDNELAFHIRDGKLEGVLRRQDKTGTYLPVKAIAGSDSRFKDNGTAPSGDLSGTYDILFKGENGKEEKAVGLFKQDGNKLRGTFLRITGDARYLEGVVEGDRFYFSAFIGSSPVYYKGSFTSKGQLTGEAVGPRGGLSFSGELNDKAALPDPYGLTSLKEGYTSFDFSFPDLDGRLLSLHDKKFSNKVVIVTIGGTWCPNCIDETAFLAPWYAANHAKGVEIVSIQYERQTDSAYVRKVLTRFRKKYNIQYDQVFGGLADKQKVAASLPALNTFLAFPTTLIIDRKGKVARIHTGYSGPATGKYYQQFVKEFNDEVNSLVNQ